MTYRRASIRAHQRGTPAGPAQQNRDAFRSHSTGSGGVRMQNRVVCPRFGVVMVFQRALGLVLAPFAVASLVACDNGSDPASSENDAPEVSDAMPHDATADSAVADDVAPATPLAERVTLDAPSNAVACDAIALEVRSEVEGLTVEWELSGIAVPTILGADARSRTVRAPAVANERTLSVVARVEDATGAQATLNADVTLTPGPDADSVLGFAQDCAPFAQGVTSGDPTETSVLLWTRYSGDAPAAATLRWEVASDPAFASVVTSGEASPAVDRDATVIVDASGLEPDTSYWYRFLDAEGNVSSTGHARTAGDVDGVVRLGAVSCSSIFSGFFNAYGRLAEAELDLVVHLGDYVYDTIDPDERVRVPEPEPGVPASPSDWQARYRLYLLDPDFRDARAAHAWLVIWDNHEADESPSESEEGSVAVFQSYVPMRLLDAAAPREAWRVLRYGAIADVFMLDVTVPREADPEGEQAMFGAAQWAWLQREIGASTAQWRVLGQQKLVAELAVPSTDLVGSASAWNTYTDARTALFNLLRPVGDNVILSGDFHTTVLAELVDRPTEEPAYNPATDAARSAGIEVLAASVTRGNFDETICGGPCETAFQQNFVEALGVELAGLNPHFGHLQITDHGYGVVEIRPESVSTTMFYTPILEPSLEFWQGPTLSALAGANQWTRPASE